ncbi:MAG: hypothetical protein HYR63_07710 [Proteobacteria bacterium]|nr:hypothetical protein [Pseudomonadota bacterium]
MWTACAAIVGLCLSSTIVLAQSSPPDAGKPAAIPFTPACRPVDVMIARAVAGVAPEEIRRTDFEGEVAASLLARINAEPPESTLAGNHLTLLERDGWDALIAVSQHGCFVGGVRLGHEVVQRLIGERS